MSSEPRDSETDFFIQTSWIDRRGDLIMSHEDIPAGPLLVNIGQQANFVPEGERGEIDHRSPTQGFYCLPAFQRQEARGCRSAAGNDAMERSLAVGRVTLQAL
jgi:hypothetical protein